MSVPDFLENMLFGQPFVEKTYPKKKGIHDAWYLNQLHIFVCPTFIYLFIYLFILMVPT
jgi:hypothetical protein